MKYIIVHYGTNGRLSFWDNSQFPMFRSQLDRATIFNSFQDTWSDWYDALEAVENPDNVQILEYSAPH